MSGWEFDIVIFGWANLAIGIAALISSITGFGYALLAIPMLVIFLAPQVVVPIVLMSYMPLSLLLAREALGDIAWSKIGQWLLGAIPGTVVGAYGLAYIDEGLMRGTIGILTIVAALSVWLRPASPFKRDRLIAATAGLVSGIMAGASGVSGPPVVLFGLNQGWDYRVLRACLIAYFAVLHALTIAVLGNFGVVNGLTLAMAVGVLPGMFIGYLIGIRLKEWIYSKHLRTLTLIVVSLAGLAAMIRY